MIIKKKKAEISDCMPRFFSSSLSAQGDKANPVNN